MLVVRKAFSNNGVTLTAGSIISEPAAIKRFNYRLRERIIIEVTEKTFKKYQGYFLTKFGVDITPAQKEECAPKEAPVPTRVLATFKG